MRIGKAGEGLGIAPDVPSRVSALTGEDVVTLAQYRNAFVLE